MAQGDTYVWCPPGTCKDHLWIVISDANHDGQCVVINLTESLHAPHSLILVPGQHPYIYKDSDVNFGDAFLTSENELQGAVATGSARPQQPMAPDIVTQIIERAKTHPAFTPILIDYLPD